MSAPDDQPGRDSDPPSEGPSAPWLPPLTAMPSRPGPESAGEAMALALAGLRWLASADLASAPASVQADCLRDLEGALSAHAAARANALTAFTRQAGYESDGQGSPRTWLTWQTRITRPAASAALASMRQLNAHPAIPAALRGGAISTSWARQICDWTDQLPGDARDDADAILLAAAAGGAELADLAALAEEMRRRLARPDTDPDGFTDRGLHLATTLGGAGRLHADLTPQCAAALQAVLESLSKKAGPEDTRTGPQRDHDAVEEACRRLIGSGCLPERAGQPTQIQLHISLDELTDRLRGQAGQAGLFGPAWQAGLDGQAGLAWQAGDGPGARPWPGAGPGYDCDAAIAPIVTGRVDHALLDQLAARLAGTRPDLTGPAPLPQWLTSQRPGCRHSGSHCANGNGTDGNGEDAEVLAACRSWAAARQLILANAIALLSGPHGLAARLRAGTLCGPAATISLPLDVGTVTDTIPPHLRRAVILRDKHCAAPGCDQPPAACQVHHLTPRSEGGATKLDGLLLLCSFHHLILVHQWGWTIALNPDGTTTMTSPNGGQVFRSHSPPATTAA